MDLFAYLTGVRLDKKNRIKQGKLPLLDRDLSTLAGCVAGFAGRGLKELMK
jgi:hypothetical protein